jgi:hypothetical protein
MFPAMPDVEQIEQDLAQLARHRLGFQNPAGLTDLRHLLGLVVVERSARPDHQVEIELPPDDRGHGQEREHGRGDRDRAPAPPREQRSVHAIPTNADLKMARALDLFNASAHPRTVAGVARSLGSPIVAVRPSPTEGSVVTIVVGWELSWYRFEVDLGDEAAGVRLVTQGTELSELEPADQIPNAAADEQGDLHLVKQHA